MSRLGLAGTITSVALILVTLVLAVKGGGSKEGKPSDAAHFATVEELVNLSEDLGQQIYWAGERPPDRVEVRGEPDGEVYLRYLPPGVDAGDPAPSYLTVGTYPVPDAQKALRRAAGAAGASVERLAGGSLLFRNPRSEGSVYLADPGSDLQIEVYHPRPGTAMRLAQAGAIRPVGR